MLDRMPHGRDDGSATSGATPDGTPDGSPDWTLENDDIVRRALLSLRQDVDAHASAGVDVVKRVGDRRRRSRWRVAGLGLAAASVAIAAVGLSGVLRPKPGIGDPATDGSTSLSRTSLPTAVSSSGPSSAGSPSASSSSSASPSSPASSSSPASASSAVSSDATPGSALWADMLKEHSILPTAKEWQAVLGVPAAPSVTQSPAGVGDLLCRAAYAPGTPVTAQDVTVDAKAGPMAKQVTFIYASEEAAIKASSAMSEALGNCPDPKPETITQQSTDVYSEHPVMWSFADSDGNTGWVTVTQRGRSVSYLETWSAGAGLSLTQFALVTNLVENRLETYGEGAGSGTKTRYVAGPSGSVPPDAAFLDPADFASTTLTGGAATEAGAGEFDGSPQVTQACDTDTARTGTFGLMKVKKAGVDASYFATQRVRDVGAGASDAADLAAAEVKRLSGGFSGCDATAGQTRTTAAAGPTDGQWRLETTFGDGTAPFVEYAVVAASTGTPGYVSTIVLTVPTGSSVPADDYWAELTRLADLVTKG